MITGTIRLLQAAESLWDIVVLGAGPAGAVCAMELARTGLKVLLIDKKQFPREKVCGGCLNAEAVSQLKSIGLEKTLESLHAWPIRHFSLWASGKTLEIDLPEGLAVDRARLDIALIQESVAAGTEFLPGVDVQVGDLDSSHEFRILDCRQDQLNISLHTRVAVVATGLNSEPVVQPAAMKLQRLRHSRIGVQATLPASHDEFPYYTIVMIAGRQGYIGLVRTDREHLHAAAAIDPEALKQDSIIAICKRIATESGYPLPPLFEEKWHGTAALTCSRRQVASDRLFVIGDAAGYVEPFTGEGMANAIRSALAVAPIARDGATKWSSELIDQWRHTYQNKVRRREWVCRGITQLLRMPRLTSTAITLARSFPAVGNAVVRSINHGIQEYEPHLGIRNCSSR